MSVRADRTSAPLEGRFATGRRGAEVRGVAYALFSQLVASPDARQVSRSSLPPPDLDQVTRELETQLPYRLDFAALRKAADDLDETDGERLARHYARLFEVGSDGPPVPLREELAAARPGSAKEEVVRFYSFFGYRLVDSHQWAPDHLAVELEFLHFLAFKESQVRDKEECRSYVLAQLDFLERHPLGWFEQFTKTRNRFWLVATRLP